MGAKLEKELTECLEKNVNAFTKLNKANKEYISLLSDLEVMHY